MKKTFGIIFVSVLIGFMASVLVGDWVRARIATLDWVQRHHLLSPRAPLVINTREEVRVSDSNDIISLINRSKGKVVAVIDTAQNPPRLLASATAVLSDGVFVTSKAAVENKAVANLLVVQSDGTTRTVSRIALDPMSGAAFLTTNASGLSVVRFVTDNSLTAGDRVGFLGAGVDGSPYFAASFVSGFERTSDGPNSSDAVSRVLPIEPTTGLLPGQAVLTLSGDMAGMWDGVSVIPGSVLSEAVTSLVQNQGQVIRPVFGFSYAVSSSIPAKASGKVAGLLVTPQEGLKTAVVAGSAAQKAGLAMGDIIVKIGDVDLAATRVPDAVLAAQKPGATVTFVVQRAGSTVNLSLVPAASGSMAK